MHSLNKKNIMVLHYIYIDIYWIGPLTIYLNTNWCPMREAKTFYGI